MEKEVKVTLQSVRQVGDPQEFKGKMEVEMMELPKLPDDAATKTYTLKAVNGVLTWVVELAQPML